MKPQFLSPILAWIFVLAPLAAAADIPALVKQLGSENESDRAAAISDLQKIGQPAEEALRAVTDASPRQFLLARRLLGDFLVARSTLQPLDLSTLAPMGENKAESKTGNPFVLLNKDKKIIVLDASFMLERGLLECLAVSSRVPNARTWETVVSVKAMPRDICMALLVCAYTFADELTDDNRINLPKEAGVMVSVEFLWEPPWTNMEAAPNLVNLCKTIVQKQNQLTQGQQTAERRALLSFDLESDVSILKDLLEVVPETDAAASKIMETLQKSLANENAASDNKVREALIPLLTEYLKLKGALGKEIILPEKRLVRIPIEFCSWNTSSGKIMKRVPFAFTGSVTEKDPETGRQIFVADTEGTVIALKYEKAGLLNTLLDTRDVNPYRDAGFVINRQVIPWRKTKCRLVFEPWTEGKLSADDLKDVGGLKPQKEEEAKKQ